MILTVNGERKTANCTPFYSALKEPGEWPRMTASVRPGTRQDVESWAMLGYLGHPSPVDMSVVY